MITLYLVLVAVDGGTGVRVPTVGSEPSSANRRAGLRYRAVKSHRRVVREKER